MKNRHDQVIIFLARIDTHSQILTGLTFHTNTNYLTFIFLFPEDTILCCPLLCVDLGTRYSEELGQDSYFAVYFP